ncbi:protein of unknown function DUF488 [Acidothermus cellulolyticus 11B]|uniref:Uroporphyrin-III C-methyltransferase n=1 Tax=Acidothermus cellulolyticus (strain ATCC 43068 / DSM 8971 / 11B) TaxID=351607 RepID=A0LSI6_ACIC1|nr:DUF488 family protein [Acidothermus cellulolyticus]ABK52396.1 protein of unknown function DUF488 [Acidothermus cellulolyticus 11B]
MGTITARRSYDDAPHAHEKRYLVERLWPRGVRKEDLALDGWLKDVAPSPELRQWFGHDPAKWEEFRRRYIAELDAHPESWRPLLEAARTHDVVLLYSARDETHNNAVVLRDYLRKKTQRAGR